MQFKQLNQQGFTIISTLAATIMVLSALTGLLVMSVYSQKKMNELFFHRCAMLASSNYYQILSSQIKSNKMSPSQLSLLRVNNIVIGKFFNGVGETDNVNNPSAVNEKDYYTEVKGNITSRILSKFESVVGVEGRTNYYELSVGCDWFIDGIDENDNDSPELHDNDATFYVNGYIY